MSCISAFELGKKLGIGHEKIVILASMSGANIEWKKGLPYICGKLDKRLLDKYNELLQHIKNNEIIEVDVQMATLFKEYKMIQAYSSLFVTRRVSIPASYLIKFPEFKKDAILFANTYYVTPETLVKIKLTMQKEKERRNIIELDDIEES